jgi:hypothetical protein
MSIHISLEMAPNTCTVLARSHVKYSAINVLYWGKGQNLGHEVANIFYGTQFEKGLMPK